MGQSQILPYLKGIAKNGYSIHIISCEKQTRLDKEKQNILNQIKDLQITWDYLIYNENGNFLSRYGYVKKLKQLAKSIIQKNDIKLIHCRSYLASLIGLSFKFKQSIPFVFDMRGFWADERIDGEIWSKKNILQYGFYKYFKYKEQQFLKYSNAIVSLTKAGLTELSKKNPDLKLETKTTIIPCCTNTNLFSRVDSNTVKINGISSYDHVLVYSGSIGTWYYTKELIDCLLVWKSKIPNLKLLILTKDNIEINELLKSYSDEVKQSIVVSSANYNQMPAYLSLAKAAIFFIKPAYSKIASSPTKMAECWAMNLPIITNAGIGDNDIYFNKHEGGILIDDFNENQYNKACDNYLSLIKKNTNYRDIALTHFDTDEAIKRYTTIYNQLTN